MRLPVEPFAGLCLAALLAGCSHAVDRAALGPAAAPASGPAADYPMVLGAPFTVEGVTYTPADTYNYDAVGYAAVGGEGGTAISLAHRTLPLPSYVEVTSLKTGKTILVRAERRGPMTGANLVELSPGAAAQLGLSGEKEPVRVRRVNPPEPERALLRMGQPAPERMETPMSLVSVLMRKLEPTVAAAPPVPPPSAVEPAKAPVVAKPAEKAKDADKPKVAAAPPPATAKPAPEPGPRPAPQKPKAAPSAKPAAKGAYAVQVATFSNPALATAAARKLGGAVSDAGKFHRVRITGFASAADAGAALAKAKAAGYSDARILRAD